VISDDPRELVDDDTPTTRRFARSTREAFDDERTQWIEPPDRYSLAPLWLGITTIVAVLLLLLLA
jgi:hypothetical protein